MASYISDVRYSFSLEDAIVQLVDFDDNKLFPYIRKLIDTFEDILKPSQFRRIKGDDELDANNWYE